MSRIILSLHFFIMFFTVASYAQKKQGGAMQWEIAACLPASGCQDNGLGVGGAVTGVLEGALIVAGGANFADSMSLLGGKKKYYGDAYVYFNEEDTMFVKVRTFQLPFAVAYAANCS